MLLISVCNGKYRHAGKAVVKYCFSYVIVSYDNYSMQHFTEVLEYGTILNFPKSVKLKSGLD